MVKEKQKFEIRIFSYLPNPRIWKTTITSRLSGVNLDIIGTSPESIKDWLWDFNARKLTKKDRAEFHNNTTQGKMGFAVRLYKTNKFS